MPCRPHSIASVRVSAPIPARAADEWAMPAMPRSGQRTTEMTRPPFAIIQRLATAWVRNQGASRFRRRTARQPPGEMSSAAAVNWPPALFTRQSIRPNRDMHSSTSPALTSGSRMSPG
jgi:hypothetical protein